MHKRLMLRQIIVIAGVGLSTRLVGQQFGSCDLRDGTVSPLATYCRRSDGIVSESTESADEWTGERPHTLLEAMQCKFGENNRRVFGSDLSSSTEAPAGTISADEARHPLSGRGERLIEKGQSFAHSGDHQAALDMFEQALKESSSAPYAHGMMGAEYLKINNISAAIPNLRAAIQSMPGVAANHSNLGYAYLISGNRKAGERELNEAIRLDPVAPQSQLLLGLVLLDQGNLEAGKYLQFAQRTIKRAGLALAIFHIRHGQAKAGQKDLKEFYGRDWPKEGQNAEKWVALAAHLKNPSKLFGIPEFPEKPGRTR